MHDVLRRHTPHEDDVAVLPQRNARGDWYCQHVAQGLALDDKRRVGQPFVSFICCARANFTPVSFVFGMLETIAQAGIRYW